MCESLIDEKKAGVDFGLDEKLGDGVVKQIHLMINYFLYQVIIDDMIIGLHFPLAFTAP